VGHKNLVQRRHPALDHPPAGRLGRRLEFAEPAVAEGRPLAAGHVRRGLEPGVPALQLDVQTTNRRTRPTPFTGGTANGGAYTPDVKNPVDAFESEVSLKLRGIEIGNWINDAPLAGETFGWGPFGSGAIVYVGRGDRLTLMDQEKRRAVAATLKHISMPAWSSDGTRLAFVQKTGKKSYRLMTVAVDRATL